jgi:DNA-binding MarR family transcriptional regulator
LPDIPPAIAALAALHQIQDALHRAFEADERLSGYTNSEKLLLFRLSEPLRMGEVAEALRCLPSNVTALVDQLESAGLVRREPCAGDRRVKQLVLTENGVAVRITIIGAAAEIFARVTGLGREDVEQLLWLLSRCGGLDAAAMRAP